MCRSFHSAHTLTTSLSLVSNNAPSPIHHLCYARAPSLVDNSFDSAMLDDLDDIEEEEEVEKSFVDHV
jgi:hypothetical protein